MKVCVFLAAVCVSIQGVFSAGAGRAIPIATENFVEELFQRINRNIRYDSTNFLVDLAGNYANCGFLGRTEMSTISKRTPEGGSIGVIQDYAYGDRTDTGSVDSYLRPVFDKWVSENDLETAEFRAQIATADIFGCSVRPGCRGQRGEGQLSVACLFTPAYTGDYPNEEPEPTPAPTIPPLIGEQTAQAFTFEQYDIAEFIFEQKWDAVHYLENLSGFETKCSMIGKKYHKFEYATEEARRRGKTVKGQFGYAVNAGDTTLALEKVLKGMAKRRVPNAKKIGCSLIPHCGNEVRMYVVASCVFEV